MTVTAAPSEPKRLETAEDLDALRGNFGLCARPITIERAWREYNDYRTKENGLVLGTRTWTIDYVGTDPERLARSHYDVLVDMVDGAWTATGCTCASDLYRPYEACRHMARLNLELGLYNEIDSQI